MIIAISGKKFSGKDTVARILQYYTIPKESRTISIDEWLELDLVYEPKVTDKFIPKKQFATKLKDISAYLLNTNVENFEDFSFKASQINPTLWTVYKVRYSDKLKLHIELFTQFQEAYNFFTQCCDMGYECQEPIKETLTYRDFLILSGTNGYRNCVHPNIWVYSLFADFKDGDNWIISDVRFKNELEFVKTMPSVLIRVNRETGHHSDDITEIDLDDSMHQFNYIIDNNSTIENLDKQIYNIIKNSPELNNLFYV